jgi:tetratricopeptide (TPR) repeat protein
MRNVSTLFFLFILSGCAASINAHNAQSYARNASRAAQQGDWDAARRMWAGAVVNSSLAHADKRYQAVMNYEYARSLGVTCFYDLAQQYFETAYSLDKETNGPAYMSLVELSRMYAAKGDHKKAAAYFARSYQEGQAADLEKHDPIGFADMIADHAKVLSALGEAGAAQEKQRIAAALRQANINAKTKTDITPYGTQCVKQAESRRQ